MTDVSIVISAELKKHYDLAIKFRDDLLAGNNLTKNSDIVSSMNSVTRLLSDMTKQLEAAENAENFASVKSILISVLKDTDTETSTRFTNALKEKQLI